MNRAPLEFAGTVDTLGGGMLCFGFEDCAGGPEAHVWLATWGVPDGDFDALEGRWRSTLERAFA